jgi:predicted TIM-barrel fold metal-dependent hydrolase
LGPPYADVVPFAQRLLKIASDRIVWGSDWPHTGLFDLARVPDDGMLIDTLVDFVPDETLRNRVLVENPKRLIGETEL